MAKWQGANTVVDRRNDIRERRRFRPRQASKQPIVSFFHEVTAGRKEREIFPFLDLHCRAEDHCISDERGRKREEKSFTIKKKRQRGSKETRASSRTKGRKSIRK